MSTACLDKTSDTDPRSSESASGAAGRLTRQASLNAVASLLDYAVKIAVTALVTPILVAGLGGSLFGVWQMLGRLVSYMAAADGRPTEALKWVIANQQASDDTEAKRRQVGSALGVWLLFLPILAITGAILVYCSPWITKVSPEASGLVRLTCALLVGNFLLSGLIMLPEAVLRGMNLGYKRMGLVSLLNIGGGLLSAGALYLGGGLWGIAAAEIGLSGITAVLFWRIVRKYVSWFGIIRPSLSQVRSFAGLSLGYLAWTLTNKLLLASDVLLLGIAASAAAVTTYTLTSYAGLTLLSIISLVLGAVTPGLGGVIGRRQFAKVAALRSEMLAISWLLSAAFGSTILLWNRSFVSLWVGSQHYAGFWSNLLIVLVMIQFVFIRNDAYIIDLTLQQSRKVILGLAAVILSIGLCTTLVPHLGIAGLCLGLLVGRIVLTVGYPLMVRAFLGESQRLRPGGAIRPALVLTLLLTGSAYAGQNLLAGSWIECALCAVSTFGMVLCIAFAAGLRAESRRLLRKRVSMLRFVRAGI
jgi:O-antigen/teichoic acid export membrane protein